MLGAGGEARLGVSEEARPFCRVVEVNARARVVVNGVTILECASLSPASQRLTEGEVSAQDSQLSHLLCSHPARKQLGSPLPFTSTLSHLQHFQCCLPVERFGALIEVLAGLLVQSC